MTGRIGQMFDNGLEPIRGWLDQVSLIKTRPLAAALLNSATSVPAGRVAHLNDDGAWELGASGWQMPCFLWQGKDDPDVFNDGVSPNTGEQNWLSIIPTGDMTGLVANGTYELQTTEFDDTQTYLPNQPLKPDSDGKLTNQSITTGSLVCGITSWFENADVDEAANVDGPVHQNAHGITVLTFWTVYIPPRTS
jgi:hypothetical protein